MGDTLLTSNNRGLCQLVRRGRWVNGSSMDVFVAVRDLVHRGCLLLTHPLYGNLRPHQQPFRSILLEEREGLVDLDSLSWIEEAVAVYRAEEGRVPLPDALPEGTRADYAFIDAELMRESLERYGQLRRGVELRPASLKTLI